MHYFSSMDLNLIYERKIKYTLFPLYLFALKYILILHKLALHGIGPSVCTCDSYEN